VAHRQGCCSLPRLDQQKWACRSEADEANWVLFVVRKTKKLNGTHPAMCVALRITRVDLLWTRTPTQTANARIIASAELVSKRCWTLARTLGMHKRVTLVIIKTSERPNLAIRSRNASEVIDASMSRSRLAYIGKRHATHLCADAYGKGIIRSQQESINLRVAGANDNVKSAESFHAASCANFPGGDLIQWRESIYQNADYVKSIGAISVERGDSRCKTPIVRNLVFLYGHRPSTPSIWYLSPCEFAIYWTVELATYSLNPSGKNQEAFHTTLTEEGQGKLKTAGYMIKDAGCPRGSWLPLPDNKVSQKCRHTWVFARSKRPRDPSFARCPMPRRGSDEVDRNAALVMTYFHAFALNPEMSAEHVPFLGRLCPADETWNDSLRFWLNGRILTEEFNE
jgi:hypothetical protein